MIIPKLIYLYIFLFSLQSNLDYLDPNYPDYSIIQIFFSDSNFSMNFLWILISCDLENSKSQKAQ